jgi:hypothetical protein
MVNVIKVVGKMICMMGKEYSIGQMAGFIKANLNKIIKTEKEFIYFLMEIALVEHGRKINCMV